MQNRECPIGKECCSKPYCDILCGVGGAGGFSDGKITLSSRIGTHYERLLNLPEENMSKLIAEVLGTIQQNVPNGVYYGKEAHQKEYEISRHIKVQGYKGYHIGTDGARVLVQKLYNNITDYCDILLESEVIDLHRVEDGCNVIFKCRGNIKKVVGRYVVLATGLEGNILIETTLKKLDIDLKPRSSDIGIRIETHYKVFEDFMENLYDFKIYYKTSTVALRTFCVNHMGRVLTENHKQLGICGVNGHAYLHDKTSNTNFAILATITPEYLDNPIEFVRDLARGINQENQGYPIYQTLDEFLEIPSVVARRKEEIQRTNDKVRYGNIQKRFPNFLYDSFRSFLLELIEAFPIMQDYQSYVYAPEIKYFQYKLPLTPQCNIPNTNVYVIGNASGHTVSLMGAAVMGIIASLDIISKPEMGVKND